ncbi:MULTISPECIES: sugar phosphate isomerase/epimerase family protein [unclassified Chelatococcus]|uniref:sugar phosphate isomerase/epimerase family protein n=1 Tax=unclassified Chelatococcus TaxID=2638111 RepID=UPI001BD13BDD|nr:MULTISPECIES: sugar phosphate isomerase/epimerase family protein [unclassified Chelatococcus]MBS7699599.1 sugar phosphate isomerase/epimerase [Chelatococcus sp. YT9]MBX3557201.1 sugar phosphate isomerase/epimerase [Chelatococcus sp.]
MNPLSIHSYTFLPTWTTQYGEEAARQARAAGYQCLVIPLRDHEAIEAAAIVRIMEREGLRPVTTANQRPDADISSTDRAIWAAGLERHRLSLRLARDLGAKHMGGILYSVFGKAQRAATEENVKAAAEALALLADEAAGFGMRIALEIVNRYETNLLNTAAQGIDMVRRVGAPNLHLHLDTFHMNIEEDDPLEALKAARPYLAYFEIDQSNRGPLDRGVIDFAPMLAFLKASNYTDMIGVEAFSSAISGPEVAAGVGAWRNLFDDGAAVARSGIAVLKQAGFA